MAGTGGGRGGASARRGPAEGAGGTGRGDPVPPSSDPRPPFDPLQVALEVEAELERRGDPTRAEQERRYLKSQREHFGVTVPGIRAAVLGVTGGYAEPTRPHLIEVVERLWERPAHECRFVAVELLERFGRLLEPQDVALLERLIRESGTWALVDGLAASVTGPLVERHPDLGSVLDDWARDPDFWIRRSALLALLLSLRRGGGDFERFARYADGMIEEEEFFIRKAIGWVLREVGKKRPGLVRDWLLPRAARASGLTVREAVKHLPPGMREEVMDARRAADPR